MKPRLALLALPLALAACDAQSMADFRMPWDKPAVAPVDPNAPPKPAIPDPTGASPLDQPLEVGGKTAAVATAERETLAVTAFVAAGEGWTAAVSDGSARFERPGAKPATVSVRRVPYAGGVEYIGTLNSQPFALTIRGEDCGNQPMTASLRANGRTFAGCAAPAAAAGAAAAAAAPKA
ncbi:hypothetical protein [Paracoccus luteus]|uniref:hypothetical protein n=1 Tax=Paracoccus luteus TaxID=2508543 RepID=UPI0010702914|nr:hypothetical protein [Paracoccus luteus]